MTEIAEKPAVVGVDPAVATHASTNTKTLPPRPIAGSVIVITGASSGIGRATALRLAGEGASLVLAARRGEVLDALVTECAAQGEGLAQAMAVPTDVGEPDDVQALAEAAVARFGRIDVWINNAGIGVAGRFEDIPLADHLRTLQTTLLGTVIGSHTALQQFRRQGQGTLINVASTAGKLALPFYGSYSTSKFGVVGLGSVLFRELQDTGEKNIRVCTVNPWATDTPWFDHAGNYTGHRLDMFSKDDPEHVVDALLQAIARPQEEINVGLSKPGLLAARALPTLAEAATTLMAKRGITKGDPRPHSSGSLYESLTIDATVRRAPAPTPAQ